LAYKLKLYLSLTCTIPHGVFLEGWAGIYQAHDSEPRLPSRITLSR